jgi:tRNA(fMet)-specific endonuclease VapC
MTGNKILLDTNIVIEVLSGNTEIADKINKFSGFSICSIVLGELYIGLNRGINKSKNLKVFNDFLQGCTLINIDNETAKLYGEIVSKLYKKGKPIPTNDIWIAASAKQHGFTLITRDKHFKEIEDIDIKHW